MSLLQIRVMTEQDLPGADQLRRLAGWNQTIENWQRLLDLAPTGCFVATCAAGLVGTVTTTSYGATLAWIGMMLVHPDERRKGIATQLMRQALAHLQQSGVKTVKLDATPAGRPLYEQLGFVPESNLTRWQLDQLPTSVSLEASLSLARSLEETDWAAVEKIDAAAFGVERLRVLRAFAGAVVKSLTPRMACEVPAAPAPSPSPPLEERAGERRPLNLEERETKPASPEQGAFPQFRGSVAVVCPTTGPISGWGLLRAGAASDYLGPVVCPGQPELLALVCSLLGHATAGRVTWDIPDDNAAARQIANRLGFQTVRPLARMRLGPPVPASAQETLCGIVDPAVG
jgi:predicted N-acetyltransferase YhbS